MPADSPSPSRSDCATMDLTRQRLQRGRDVLIAQHPDVPVWVVELLDEAVAKIQALRANSRLAQLDELACSLFDGEPVSAEEALRALHGEVMRLQGAEVAKATPSTATIHRVELDHVSVGADGRVGIGGAAHRTATRSAIRLPDRAFDGFAGMDWMDDIRVWRGALLSLVSGRTGELLEHWGEDYHREAILAGDGDSAWYDNLPAPLQARWLALVRERRAMERLDAGGGYWPDHDGTASAAERLMREIQGCLDLIPKSERVRVREGGREENLPASLAVSVARLVQALTAERTALAELRTHIKRSIESDLSVEEAVGLLAEMCAEDQSAVDAWITAMADPDYWSKEVAQHRKEREEAESLDGLIKLLDKLWPEDVWPADGPPEAEADPGARLVRVARLAARLERRLAESGMSAPAVTLVLPEHPRAGGTRAVGAPEPHDGPGTLELNTDPPDWSTAGRRARWARKEAGLSMGQAARLFELSTSTISAYEVGDFGCAALADADTRGPIPDDLLVRMADAYGVRLSFLRTGAVPEQPDEETRNMLARLAIRSSADADRIGRLLSVHGKDPE